MKADRRQDLDAAAGLGRIEELGQPHTAEIAVRQEQRENQDARRRELSHRLGERWPALDEAATHVRGDAAGAKRARQVFDAAVVGARRALAMRGQQEAGVPQWLVPSENVILFHTLYFPDGRDIGIRFTSAKVTAS